jgi:hypothetical protein
MVKSFVAQSIWNIQGSLQVRIQNFSLPGEGGGGVLILRLCVIYVWF